jgi:Ca2+-binding RTX toxin-like protein
MAWKIEARELPVAGLGTHLYIEMWDDAGNRYKQMHGYWTDPVSGQPSTSGDDSGLIKGYNNLVLNSTLGSTPSNHPHAGTTLFDGSEVQVKEAFRYASSAVEYINAQNYSYTLLGAGSLSSNGTKFNSNNVFSTLVDAVQLAVPINQSIVGGVESPHSFIGAGTNMFRGNEWRPNVDMPSVDQNGNVVYGSWVRDTGETNTLIGTQYNDVLIGSDTTITGGNSLDTLIGNEGNDYLDGRTGKDSLIGGAGNDTIDGGLDNGDVAEGGAGNDTYIFNGAFGSNEYVKDSDGQGRIVIDGNTLSGVATLVVNTSSTTTWTLQGYTLRASGNIAIDSKGTAGNSVMVYDLKPGQSWLGITLDNTTNGTAGNDSLGGGKYADSMVGAAGNDTISAGAGNDTLVGGTGADLLRGDSGNDTYVYKAADGADTISDGYSSTDITDSVTITGYALSAASFSRVGTTNDLRIAFTGSSTDSILVQQGLDGNYSVESFVFASGGTKTIAAIRADVLAAQTTAGNDNIPARPISACEGSHFMAKLTA